MKTQEKYLKSYDEQVKRIKELFDDSIAWNVTHSEQMIFAKDNFEKSIGTKNEKKELNSFNKFLQEKTYWQGKTAALSQVLQIIGKWKNA
jgi:hypothetical protein